MIHTTSRDILYRNSFSQVLYIVLDVKLIAPNGLTFDKNFKNGGKSAIGK